MKLGYRVGDRLFDSKAKALLSADNDVSKVNLYFYDHIYDNVDWSMEPTQSWISMLDEEVFRVRNSFDHVAVWYSGGYDSHTIVDSFARQRLPIDELIVYRRGWLDYSIHEYKYAMGLAKILKENYFPRCKITTIVKQPQDIADRYAESKKNWIDNTTYVYHLTKTRRQWDHKCYDDTLSNRSTSRIYIEGKDKPRLNIRDGWWYASCDDALAAHALDGGEDDLHFYWNPYNPQIYVKQCWMMVNWIETNFEFDHQWLHDLQSNKLGNEMFERWNIAIGRTPLSWPDARWGLGTKVMCGNGLHSSDNKIVLDYIKQNHDDLYRQWTKDINEVRESFVGSWDENKGDFKTVVSKSYAIKPVDHTRRIPLVDQ